MRRDDVAGLDAAIDDDTAALVPEVIQGEGGAHPLSRELLEAGQRQCRERGALLLIDDVQTGIGRTRAWLAHSRFRLEPDLVTLGRGIAGGFPLSATCMTGEVAEALFPGAHGTTFGGGPLGCQAGLTTRETLAEEGLVERARVAGERLLGGLEARLRGLPGVRAVRGGGLMVGVELRRRVGPILARLLRDHQIRALQAGSTVLHYLPPLVISDTGIDLGIEATAEVVSP